MKWYVAYTCSRSEKKVHTNIQERRIQSYLPLQKVQRQWSDRQKTVELPLFANYVFVHTTEDQIPALNGINGLVRFIAFEGRLATLQAEEIDAIKQLINRGQDICVEHGLFRSGQATEVIGGPFKGMKGKMSRQQGKARFLIEIQALKQVLSISIPRQYLKPI
ncbi:MAG: UpxY family transcription antiterminator [Bacteroidota bacterium]